MLNYATFLLSQKHISTKSYVILFYTLIYSATFGQNITPSTQNITASLGNQNGYSLLYSVGEMVSVVNYIGLDKSSLSSGFLQSFSPLVTGLNELSSIQSGSMTIAPNPVITKMYLRAHFSNMGQLEFNIVDAYSNLRYQSNSFTIFNNLDTQLDMQDYAPGVYYMRVWFKPNFSKMEYGVFKIIKL